MTKRRPKQHTQYWNLCHILCILAFHLLFLDLSIVLDRLGKYLNNTITINMGYMYYSIVIKYNTTLHVSTSFSHPQVVHVSLDKFTYVTA
jgi:hypothetical protein